MSDVKHTALDMLKAIMRHGEIANIDAGGPFTNYGGKKRPSKDVFCFPRHMLTEIEAVIDASEARASAADAELERALLSADPYRHIRAARTALASGETP